MLKIENSTVIGIINESDNKLLLHLRKTFPNVGDCFFYLTDDGEFQLTWQWDTFITDEEKLRYIQRFAGIIDGWYAYKKLSKQE